MSAPAPSPPFAEIIARKSLTIVGGTELPISPGGEDDSFWVLWDSFETDGKYRISLPRALEKEFEGLQAQYVHWRDSLALLPVKGSTLATTLRTKRDGGSLWWATPLASTPPESLPAIADILKLRLLETMFVQRGTKRIRYLGPDANLARVLKSWSGTAGFSFEWSTVLGADDRHLSKKVRLYRRLPHVVKAFFYLRSFLSEQTRRYRGEVRPKTPQALPDLAIVTYVPNIDLEKAKEGIFRSNYWGRLHDLIESLGLKVRWIWYFVESEQMDLSQAIKLQARLASSSNSTGQDHRFVEGYLSAGGILGALRTYVRFLVASFRFRSHTTRFRLHGSAIDFFPILQNEWYSSLRGANAMFCALYAAAFRAAIDDLPPSTQRLVYLWENQSWEHLLLDAWKGGRRGPSIGVAHVPNCTTRMLIRNRLTELRKCDGTYRLPDRVIAMGPSEVRAFHRLGWPEGIVDVAEALRYEYLAGRTDADRRPLAPSDRQLLVVTGVLPSEARLQLRLLRRAEELGGLERYSRIVLKAHPFCGVETILAELAFDFPIKVVGGGFERLFHATDVVFCSSHTSVSLEAAWVGLPVILSGAVEGVNLNLFKGVEGVAFAATPEELVEHLASPQRIEVPSEFLHFDTTLRRWRALLTDVIEGPVQASQVGEHPT